MAHDDIHSYVFNVIFQSLTNVTFRVFYGAKLSGARYCQGKLSVRPSVLLSVCNVEVS